MPASRLMRPCGLIHKYRKGAQAAPRETLPRQELRHGLPCELEELLSSLPRAFAVDLPRFSRPGPGGYSISSCRRLVLVSSMSSFPSPDMMVRVAHRVKPLISP